MEDIEKKVIIMAQKGLVNFFENFLENKLIFKDKRVLVFYGTASPISIYLSINERFGYINRWQTS